MITKESETNLNNFALSDNSNSNIFLHKVVRKSKNEHLKIRLQTLINSKGLSESDFYNSLGYSKQVWYAISWGIWEPTIEHKVKISQALGVDSSVIWNAHLSFEPQNQEIKTPGSQSLKNKEGEK